MVTDLSRVPTGAPPEVDPDVMRLLASCATDLRPQHAELVLAFHQRLLELVPSTARLVGSGRPMSQRLIGAVLHAAEPGQPLVRAVVAVQQVGAENYVDGVLGEQYSSVTHALLYAVRAVFRGEWSSPLSSAWVEYLIWFRAHLLIGAEVQKARDEAQGVALPAADLFTPARAGGDPFSPPEGEPSLPAAATIDDDLDDDLDDDEDEPSYGSLMMSMTLNPKRDKRGR